MNQPRYLSGPCPTCWGEDAGAAASPDYITQVATAAGAYQSAQDPRIQRATLAAKIENYKEMAKKYKGVPIFGDYYANQLSVMKAQLKALDEKLALQVEGEDAQRDWRSLGQTGVAVGVVGGVALVGLLLVVLAKVGSR